MGPDELKAVVETAVRQPDAFPWWAYLSAAAFSALGAYFGSYLRKAAEHKANSENFDAIRAQLRKTTEDTEEIKVALSDNAWRTQQHWSMREKYYTTLLEHLKVLQLSLQDRSEMFDPPGTPYSPDFVESEYFTSLTLKGSEAYQQVRQLIGPGAIFLSEQTIVSLEQLVRDHWHVAEDAMHLKEYLDEAYTLVTKAQNAVLGEAKRDLAARRANA